MGEATKLFKFILDNQQEMQKQVIQNVYNLIKTEDEKFNECIMEELSSFDFTLVERELINNIVSTIEDTLNFLNNPNESDYEAIKNNLMNNLELLKMQDYRLEDNFKDLSKKIVSRLRLPENMIEEVRSYFIKKIDKINETIQKTNNNVIETLIKHSPQLIDELQQSRSKQVSSDATQINQSTHISQSSIQQPMQKSEQQVLNSHQVKQALSDQEKRTKDDLVQEIINAMNKAGEMSWGDINFDERINRINNMRNRLYNKSIDDLQTLLSTYQNEKKEEVPIQLTQEVDMVDDFQQSVTEQEGNNLSMENPNRVNLHLNDKDKPIDFTGTLKSMDEEVNMLIQNHDTNGLKEFAKKHGIDVSNLEQNTELDSTLENSKSFTQKNDTNNFLYSQILSSRAEQIAKLVRNIVSQNNLKLESQKINKLYRALIKISQHSELLINKYENKLDNSNKNIYDEILINEIEELNEFLSVYGIDLNSLELEETKGIEPDDPKPDSPSPSVSTYIGATNEDVEKLIRANQYYSLLHGIDRESFMKYNGFIQTGFSLIIDEYYKKSALCNSIDEKLQALSELKEIYDHFYGYIYIEQSNQLRETIENMTNYIQKEQSQQMIDDIGIRYNSESSREVNSGRHM